MFAGLTVAVVALPQSMAYAMLAGAPPAFGLYTSIVSCIIAALFGSSRHLITGPTNATAIIFAATLADRVGDADLLPAIALYTLLIGIFKFLFGFLRLGRLTDYISDSVILGFTAGAGILIVGNQLKNFLGIHLDLTPGAPFLTGILETFGAIDTLNPYAVGVACGTVGLILVCKYLDARIPAALIACIVGAFVVSLLGPTERGLFLTSDIGQIPRSLPPLSLFTWDWVLAERLVGGAVAVAVIGLMEATAISTSIATSSGQRINSDREFMAQGLANIVGAFFSNFAGSGSFTRSALNYQSGAQTRMAAVFSGLFVALVLIAFGPLGGYIPVSCFAGILMVIAVRMINWPRLRQAIRGGRESTIILVVTALAMLVLRIDWAIYLGIALSLIFFLRQASKSHLNLLIPLEGNRFQEVSLDAMRPDDITGKIVFVNIVGAMYFGAVSEHVHTIRSLIALDPAVVAIRLRRMSGIDSSGIAALQRIHHELKENDIPLLLCGVDQRQYGILKRTGLVDRIGPERVVTSHDLMFNSMERTLELAKSLAKTRAAKIENVKSTKKLIEE